MLLPCLAVVLVAFGAAAGLADAAGAAAAGAAAGGELPAVMPRQGVPDGRQSGWPFGTALMRMSEQIRASHAAEAAARRSAEEMSGRLGEVSLELRTKVNVVRGFAEYYRQRGEPLPADLGRMMRRVADETAQMETLIAGLGAGSPNGSTGAT